MKVGFVGLGKLGYPLALVADAAGHEVYGSDHPWVREKITARLPIPEADSAELVARHRITMVDQHPFDDTARSGDPRFPEDLDLVFVVVDTPHAEDLDGSRLLTEHRADFDYQHLRHAVDYLTDFDPVIVSTVLPGTLRGWRRKVIYNPSFCAMGTVIPDARAPEFTLIGHCGTDEDVRPLRRFYQTIHDAPILETDLTTAEGIKVLYNTFVTAKITLANLYGELAEKLGMNVDHISTALALSSKRITSPAYLSAGMGDGGPCHPRDNLALSWLAGKRGLSFDLFGAFLEARQAHTEWIASMIPDGAVIFGTAYKAESKLEAGSPALLLASVLVAQGKRYHQDEDPTPGAYNVIATAHERYRKIRWPQGSTVLDPFGIIADQEGVTVRRLGRP